MTLDCYLEVYNSVLLYKYCVVSFVLWRANMDHAFLFMVSQYFTTEPFVIDLFVFVLFLGVKGQWLHL